MKYWFYRYVAHITFKCCKSIFAVLRVRKKDVILKHIYYKHKIKKFNKIVMQVSVYTNHYELLYLFT